LDRLRPGLKSPRRRAARLAFTILRESGERNCGGPSRACGLVDMVRRVSERSMLSRLPAARLALAGIVVLSLAACGRRGALEPPPDPSAQKKEEAAEQPAEPTVPSVIGTPSRSANPRTPYEKPKRPFILDPIL
jgi:predicted small lipoprotein YifL